MLAIIGAHSNNGSGESAKLISKRLFVDSGVTTGGQGGTVLPLTPPSGKINPPTGNNKG